MFMCNSELAYLQRSLSVCENMASPKHLRDTICLIAIN
jgi:hypothetical protein